MAKGASSKGNGPKGPKGSKRGDTKRSSGGSAAKGAAARANAKKHQGRNGKNASVGEARRAAPASAGGARKPDRRASKAADEARDQGMSRLIVVGSPRERGRSAELADLLFEACIEECPHDEVALAPVSTLSIAPCTGCDACRETPSAPEEGGDVARAADAPRAGVCVIDDDMAEVRELMDGADELIVVAPVYFAGPTAQLKSLLDRLQPYYWAVRAERAAGEPAPRKRPCTLHVVGDGDNPYGFEPLVSIVASAIACAGFSLVRVLDWTGRIDREGEIVAEADEYAFADGVLVRTDEHDDGAEERAGR